MHANEASETGNFRVTLHTLVSAIIFKAFDQRDIGHRSYVAKTRKRFVIVDGVWWCFIPECLRSRGCQPNDEVTCKGECCTTGRGHKTAKQREGHARASPWVNRDRNKQGEPRNLRGQQISLDLLFNLWCIDRFHRMLANNSATIDREWRRDALL